jgi:hypothetical protein
MDITLSIPAQISPASSAYAPNPLEANPADVTQFRALVSGEVSVNGAPVAAPTVPSMPASGGTLGDMILQTLDQVKDRIQTAYSGIDGMVAPNAPPPTVMDVLAAVPHGASGGGV